MSSSPASDASRAAIFARIRAARQARDSLHAQERAAAQAWIGQPAPGPRPHIAAHDLLPRFCQQAQKMSDSLVLLDAPEQIPAAVADFLRRHSLPPALPLWPQFAALDWAAAGVQAQVRAAQADDACALTGSYCAVAECGSLLLLSSAEQALKNAILPPNHIAVLQQSRIVPDMEAAFALLRAEGRSLPRSAMFISGPSRTGDIEQTIVLGAHGPQRVHVLLLRSPAEDAELP
ncbi:LUD domain-containing protein [Massilia sp. W12]|uniref:LutC/YkgG family protein n=1 Tax=Massilia sp. W12 TaxID=3126507 RepID=UPI0030D06688